MAGLPDFPWDSLRPAAARARAHSDGIVDLSVGTPVDPTPLVVREALAEAADAPGYPPAHGTPELRRAWVDWSVRSLAATPLDPSAVAVTVGSKELVGLLPTLLGFGPGDVVAIPQLAYPTYEVGALAAGATPVRYDPLAGGTDLALGGPAGAGRLLLWLNSPANPNGSVLDAARTRALVDAGRERGAVVASDECYAAFGWDAEPVSVLRRDIHGGDLTGLLAVHSLSKRSNLAGYRVGFVAGDPALIDRLVAVRRHLGLIVAMPVQHAAAVALADDAHVEIQRARYAARRAAMAGALTAAGLRIDASAGGLYLWATENRSAADTVDRLAGLGILVAPGTFYGAAGARHVRVALTATDERIAAAAARLTAAGAG
jgi:succinyldiaminopimelate transaminase